jgi:hypothetical protein
VLNKQEVSLSIFYNEIAVSLAQVCYGWGRFVANKTDKSCNSNDNNSKMYGPIFLLPMNGVNMKYWFRDFQKKFFYWFSGRIRTFYRRKTGLNEKKISVALPSAVCRLPSAVCRDFMAVHLKILSARFLKDAFK